jgi:hypothetical protein
VLLDHRLLVAGPGGLESPGKGGGDPAACAARVTAVEADAAASDAGRAASIRIILNAKAGAKGAIPTNDASPERLREILARLGLADDLVVSESVDDAKALTRAAV